MSQAPARPLDETPIRRWSVHGVDLPVDARVDGGNGLAVGVIDVDGEAGPSNVKPRNRKK